MCTESTWHLPPPIAWLSGIGGSPCSMKYVLQQRKGFFSSWCEFLVLVCGLNFHESCMFCSKSTLQGMFHTYFCLVLAEIFHVECIFWFASDIKTLRIFACTITLFKSCLLVGDKANSCKCLQQVGAEIVWCKVLSKRNLMKDSAISFAIEMLVNVHYCSKNASNTITFLTHLLHSCLNRETFTSCSWCLMHKNGFHLGHVRTKFE